MKAIKIRVAQATVAGDKGIVITSIDKEGNKICMTFAGLEEGGTADFIVADNGWLTSESEPLYAQLLAEIED